MNFGKAIMQNCAAGPTRCTPVVNPFGPRGAPPAVSPPIRFNLLLRDDFPIEAPRFMSYLERGDGDVPVGMVQQGHSFTQSGSNPPFVPGVVVSTQRLRFEHPAYAAYDASAGTSKGRWSCTEYGENLADSNVAVFTSTDQCIAAQTPMRPRVIGAKFGYSFKGEAATVAQRGGPRRAEQDGESVESRE